MLKKYVNRLNLVFGRTTEIWVERKTTLRVKKEVGPNGKKCFKHPDRKDSLGSLMNDC